MKKTKLVTPRVLGIGSVMVVAAVAIWWFAARHHDIAQKLVGAGETSARGSAIPERPVEPTRQASDDQPRGELRLEGQVLDADGGGVGSAVVVLATSPPRTTTTQLDGTFSFDGLLAMRYALTAFHGSEVAGPINHQLTPTSDPVVFHLAKGSSIEVTVVDDAGHPLAGAAARSSAGDGRWVVTDDAGHATLSPIAIGYALVEARAEGHAPGTVVTSTGKAASTRVRLALHTGYEVSGRVVDEHGAGVAGARVVADEDLVGAGLESSSATTDAQGHFSFPALAPGTHMLLAVDGTHAPTRSAPVTIVDRAAPAVEIRLAQGGVLTGKVVGASGTPAPYATVQVVTVARHFGRPLTREVTTDRDGRFSIHGLPRTRVQALARSERESSAVTVVDLATAAPASPIVLELAIAGEISGTVVDDTGAPVVEARVRAAADLAANPSPDAVAIAGLATATTDSSGGFSLRGLSPGTYRVWATRFSEQTAEERGVKAAVGDTGVRLVIAAPGRVVGTLSLAASHRPPSFATVRVGSRPAMPVAGGAFDIEDLQPGDYDMTIHGPEFAEIVQRVHVASGATTDLGAITARAGRRLRGTVVGTDGQPIAGATVSVGDLLVSVQGAEGQLGNLQDAINIRTGVSAEDGSFEVIGIPHSSTSAVADHATRGRSAMATIPEGADDPPPVKLVVHALGTISGQVTLDGAAAADVMVSDAPKDAGAQATLVRTDSQGHFTLDRVTEGSHVLQAIQQQQGAMKAASTTANVVAGQVTTVVLDIKAGDITLTVQIQPVPGNKVDAAQVFLFSGVATPATGKDVMALFYQGNAKGMKIWSGGTQPAPTFTELVPGAYSVCTIPITGDLTDPAFRQHMKANLPGLHVYCGAVTIAPSPTTQSYTATVPAMTPFPT